MKNVKRKNKNRIKSGLKNQKGIVLGIVLTISIMIVTCLVSVASIITQDVRLIQSISQKEQLRFVAEAGINHALATLKRDGFSSQSSLTGSLNTGDYSVTFSTIGTRCLVQSVGTVGGRSRMVSAEIADNTPTALNYFSGAGNDIHIKIHQGVPEALIFGDIHSNNDTFLELNPDAVMTIDGDVSATGIVTEGKKHNQGFNDIKDDLLSINEAADDTATVYEGAVAITFPEFEYSKYKAAAVASSSYYSSDQTFTGTLNPSSGIVYVDGDVTISGVCNLYGGMMASTIKISKNAELNQYKYGDRNIIMAMDGDIKVAGLLFAQEALICASRDILTNQPQAQNYAGVKITGIMLAGRNIEIWNDRAELYYSYEFISPPDMTDASSPVAVVSWNQ